MLEDRDRPEAVDCSALDADAAGLRFVSDDEPGITRKPWGRSFRYDTPAGEPVTSDEVKARIMKLAIPPAWTDVWICTTEDGHIQATGRDARGRKQYRYHEAWHRIRGETKFEKMVAFAETLPRIRRTVEKHLSSRRLAREKVLATVVRLLETTLIRVGNSEYARQNKSYGLTTLQDRHVSFNGSELRFKFKAKTGKEWKLKIADRRVARIVKSCQELPGQLLFQYEDESGEAQKITSSDVNAYLREISGIDVTAKDFRTWAGTVEAAAALAELEPFSSQTAAKRNVRQALQTVAARLGNTVAVCRSCYVHPAVLDSYLEEDLPAVFKRRLRRKANGLRAEEAATLHLLKSRQLA